MSRRIFVTGPWHETNTFAATATDLEAFRAYQLFEGDEVAAALAGTNTEIGGMLAAAAELALEPCCGLFAGAVPSGTVTRGAYAHLVELSCHRAAAARPVDGVLVALHGAMVAEAMPDADAAYLAAVREALGPEVPLVATFDIHAHLSPALFAAADVLIGYDTYPHTDMAARGREAVVALSGIMTTGERPARAWRKLPLLTLPQTQATDAPPMAEVIEELHRAEERPGVHTASVAVGFPYADVPHLGMAIVAYGADQAAVDGAADDLAGLAWRRRRGFVPQLVAVDDAVRRALAAPAGPVVLVDVADNVGGGAAGDGTVILRALLDARAARAVVVLFAPAAARRCRELGVGARFRDMVGGAVDNRHGPPLELDGVIALAQPVAYRRRSSYMTEQLVRLGDVAVVDAGGVRVVLTERRAMPFDADHLTVLGIAPAEQRVLVCKSAIGWRAAFGDVARAHVFVDTPGICASDLHRLPYRHRQGAMFPLDPDAAWPG
jgi:microcystin degradation protein MlrC